MEAYWIPLHEDNAEAAFDPLVVLKVHSEIKVLIKYKNIIFYAKCEFIEKKKTASLLFSLSSSSHTVNFTIDCSGTRD